MLNHRFKNPYKKQIKQITDDIISNDGPSFDFRNFKIYEFDFNKELASKGYYIFIKLKFGRKIWKFYR